MPEGSSSAAPVMTPGPIAFNSDRIHRDEASVDTKELGEVPCGSKLESKQDCDRHLFQFMHSQVP